MISLLGQAAAVVMGNGMVPLQLREDGISKAKTEVNTNLVAESGATVILLQGDT